MFDRVDGPSGEVVRFQFDGKTISALAHDSVASAILATGASLTRHTAVSGIERGPYCMMGVCFDCLIEIDGVGNRQACMVPVREGMCVKRQMGKREVLE